MECLFLVGLVSIGFNFVLTSVAQSDKIKAYQNKLF